MKQFVPGVFAFLFLVFVATTSILGFRLYQVSEMANTLLTGQCSQVEKSVVDAAIKAASEKHDASGHPAEKEEK